MPWPGSGRPGSPLPRNNLEEVILASRSRSATTNSEDQVNHYCRGVRLFLDVTANPGNDETLTLAIEMKDPASGKYRSITPYVPTVANTNDTYIYELYPGSLETVPTPNHEVQGGSLPRTWRVKVTHSGTGVWVYSLGACLIV